MRVEKRQLVLAALALAGTLLLAVWGAGVTFGGTRDDVEDLQNDVAALKTPESSRADMCDVQNKGLAEAIRSNDGIARDEYIKQMERLGCFSLALEMDDNMAAEM